MDGDNFDEFQKKNSKKPVQIVGRFLTNFEKKKKKNGKIVTFWEIIGNY